MSPSPDSGSRAPSDRLWDWFQSLTRTAEAGSDGISRIQPKQVYILPTGFGILFGVMLLAMLFGANNYGSNPGFLFTFLLAGLGLAALFQTWKNLVGIELLSVSCKPVYCGQNARFVLTLKNPFTAHRAGISAYLWKSKSPLSKAIDLPALEERTLEIEKPTIRRGQLQLGRIALTTRYPLGLLKSWAYIQLDDTCLVYPALGDTADGFDHAEDNQSAKAKTKSDGDDFAGHKPYQDGDNVMHVDWKAVARGKGWNLKNFEQNQGEDIWLRWEATTGESVEQRISALARAVTQLEKTGRSYGLVLPNQNLSPSRGNNHQHLCLQALALFEPL